MMFSVMESVVCPVTHLKLQEVPLQEARDMVSRGNPLVARPSPPGPPAFGETNALLVRSDSKAAYPVVSGVPILLAPEVLTGPDEQPQIDLSAPQYAEAYLEMPYYNDAAGKIAENLRRTNSLVMSDSEIMRHLARLRSLPESQRTGFPYPFARWASARMDLTSQWDCFRHLEPVEGQRVLQLGGQGAGALTLLLAGAQEAVLLTPMIGEALVGIQTASILGVQDKFRCVVAVAEEIPFADNSLDLVFSGGCVHHLRTEIAFPEIARVLKPGGRFAAIEPWRAPLYTLGTRVFGKREANPFCRPLTRDRVAPLFQAFHEGQCIHHGSLSRYPMLALERLGVRIPMGLAWWVSRVDDWFSGLVPGLRRIGSGVAILGKKYHPRPNG